MYKISSATVGSGGTSSIEFTSIPQTYTDLLIIISARGTRTALNDTASIRFNGVNANLSFKRAYGSGSSALTDSGTTFIPSGHYSANSSTDNAFGNVMFYIPEYTTANHKVLSSLGAAEGNATGMFMSLVAGRWADVSAITAIRLFPNDGSNSFAQHSTAYLYGINKS